LKKKGDDPII